MVNSSVELSSDEFGTNGGRTHLLCHKNTGRMTKDTTKVIFIYLLFGSRACWKEKLGFV